jgi:predicted ATPase
MGDTIGERWFEAELHRTQGEWLATYSRDGRHRAEYCLRRAIALAQQQSAKLWELCAAISLARLWGEQGRQSGSCSHPSMAGSPRASTPPI